MPFDFRWPSIDRKKNEASPLWEGLDDLHQSKLNYSDFTIPEASKLAFLLSESRL